MRRALVLALLSACSGPRSQAPVATVAVAPQSATVEASLAKLEAARDVDGVVVGPRRTPTVVVVLASWCGHCREQLAVFARVKDRHPTVRWLALNYKAHEEYDQRGSSVAIRELAIQHAPWLRVVPADEALFTAFGRPPKVPTLFIYDSTGALVDSFDRRARRAPDAPLGAGQLPLAPELDALLRSLR